MSGKLATIPKGQIPIPTADELLAGISRMVGNVSVYHERSDDMYSACVTFKGQFLTGKGVSPRQALWSLAKLMNALR